MVTIDVGAVADERALHLLLKRELGFPDFYGMNWDAFWDAIAGLVAIPDHVRFVGWDLLAERVPHGAEMLQQELSRYRAELRIEFVPEYVGAGA
ncbi:barstar family protein [Actinacidiphila soli]|uniref:barstar family protein n=1 Tax=Actinacidiphila soli TaxID=2487275 RepID=UPI000FCC0CB1|nr:barstar family protein [Actinacidiphila soli]